MNILLMDGLPEEYEGIPLSADFRNMIQIDLILHEADTNEVEKTIAALYQLYPDIPADIHKAVEGLVWFYTRGKAGGKGKDPSAQKAPKKAFDFEQDANLIYAAFYATYNISLTTVDFLHWWEFMALFEGLPENTLIQRVMYWRTTDLTGLSKAERKHILKMRKLFALKGPEKEVLSIEEVEQQTKDRVARRFAEARAALAAEK
ncbi:bacteriophage Gp15 family protein [Oscillospiraceae bacterium OttesenSCG-928-G22]|nr:bacteriophage Gp15 family protein [Oscillospiraceae bacterium OttesenSCG-928-G22]